MNTFKKSYVSSQFWKFATFLWDKHSNVAVMRIGRKTARNTNLCRHT
jgi:hypothetical protein